MRSMLRYRTVNSGERFNGASFLNYGEDFSSLIMSLAFLVALTAYALGTYFTTQTASGHTA